jgi:uncharacterized protein YgbK (DUF1537 family)
MLLGAIADDLTGATDLSLTLSREGMKTIQAIGAPGPELDFGDADAVVVALKSRTIPADDAVGMSVIAARALVATGAEQLVFKYCSTFDSTDKGNIGPVAEALMDLTGADFTVACPAFPANARSVFKGHLFVGDALLSESAMRNHPLTPMRDANLVRVLQRQTKRKIGLIDLHSVEAGVDGVLHAFERAWRNGERIVIVDAVRDEHLRTIGEACSSMKLVTGGSGIAMGLPANFRKAGKLGPRASSDRLLAPRGKAATLVGSCSAATRGQIATAVAAGAHALHISALDIAAGATSADLVADWIEDNGGAIAPIVYSSAEPAAVADVQAKLGRDKASALIEGMLASIGKRLKQRGFTRLLVAGGETSGAVVAALGVGALRIGPEIDPGVPWTLSLGDRPLALALKSGNFGAPDFFVKAWSLLQEGEAHDQ